MSRRPVVTLIVNPRAGRGRAGKVLPQVTAELVRGMPDAILRVQQTTNYTDGKLRAMNAVQGSVPPAEGESPDMLIVMGGDGMASLGLNACANTHVRLGVIPAGTGNDFCRGMGLPRTTSGAIAAIVGGHDRLVDLSEVTGDLTGGAHRRFVGSVVSTGYDAKVNRRTNARQVSFGQLSYGVDALAELAHFEPLHYRVTIDGVQRDEHAMLICVCNAGYIGGGMRIGPYADPTDGMLDLTIVHPVSRATLLRLLPRIYTGGFVVDPCVELVRARDVLIDGENQYGMADGEPLGEPPLRVRIVPGALWLMGAEPATPDTGPKHPNPTPPELANPNE